MKVKVNGNQMLKVTSNFCEERISFRAPVSGHCSSIVVGNSAWLTTYAVDSSVTLQRFCGGKVISLIRKKVTPSKMTV